MTTIHPSARIMQGVIMEGRISIGENTYIGAGSILTAHSGSIHIGANTVIMENAIIRSTEKFDCTIGDHVLIGPKACLTGARLHDACFVATNATIFHGAELGSGTVVAVNGVVHINTCCPENTFIPIQHIAFGRPARVYTPAEIPAFHEELRKTGFVRYVYDIETDGLSGQEVYQKMTRAFLDRLPPA